MRQSFNEACERMRDPTVNPQEVIEALRQYLSKEFEGWSVSRQRHNTVALPNIPGRVIQQVPEHMREDIQRFLHQPHVKIGGRWYTMEPSFFPDQDLWESNIEEIASYTVSRLRQDYDRNKCQECIERDEECEKHADWPRPLIPGREPREIWESDEWFNRLILALCGRFRQDRLVI